jgi:nuclear cap-binding protein subunit 1
MAYWHSHPGTAITIIEKLLNYSVLTPLSVIEWALVGSSHANGNGSGDALAQPHVFEMVCNTVSKVTSRVRQVHAPGSVGTSAETVEEERAREVRAMRELFRAMDDALVSWATGSKDELMEEGDGTSEREALIRRWGERWLRVFRRKAAIEESFLLDAARDAGVPVPNGS